MKVCKLTCFLQIGGWNVQEDQHNWQQGFLLNLQPTLYLSSHPQLGLIAINKRKTLAWIRTSQWPLFCSQQSSLWPVLWRPAGLFQSWRLMCPPSQLGPAVVFSGSSRGELHLPWPSSSQSHEVRFPQCGAEQDGLGGAREVTVTRDLNEIYPKC